jgi:Tfp pilus assembly protein PilV
MIEAMVAGMVLAIGAFAVAQALSYGLTQTQIARQRQAAEALANEELEAARALNFTNVGLLDAGPLTKSTDTSNPDYYLSSDGTQFDPDGAAATFGTEPLIFGQADPALAHGPTTVTMSNTTFQIYDYATWYDDPSISGSQNAKRVTVVITWAISGRQQVFRISSLYTAGSITFGSGSSASNNPPSVSCPTSTSSGYAANFTAVATDTDGTVDRVDWDFGDGATTTDGGTAQSHTYASAGTYTVTNTVWDDDGATASNSSLGCTIDITAPPTQGGDTQAPSGTISVNSGSTYTRATQVNLTLSATDDVGVTEMSFSDDGTSYGSYIAYSTVALYTVPTGDGTKTVYVRFKDAAGNVSTAVSDTILLDTAAPSAPTGFTVSRAANKKSAILQWNVVTASDLAGYAVYRRPTTSTTYTQLSCQFIYGLPNKCQDPSEDNKAVYEFYVVAIDLAGNVSADSTHVTT